MDIERLVEDGARAKAYHHFNRRQWFGYCPKEARTLWLVDKYWRQFVPDARAVLAIALAAAAEEAEKTACESKSARQECCGYGVGDGEDQQCCGQPDLLVSVDEVAERLRALATQAENTNG